MRIHNVRSKGSIRIKVLSNSLCSLKASETDQDHLLGLGGKRNSTNLFIRHSLREHVPPRSLDCLLRHHHSTFRLEQVHPFLDIFSRHPNLGGLAPIDFPILRNSAHCRSLKSEVKQQTFKVGRHKNIHSGAHRFRDVSSPYRGEKVFFDFLRFLSFDLAVALGMSVVVFPGRDLFVPSRLPESSENVVGVGRDDQLLHGETQLLGVESSEDVTKVSGWDGELDFRVGEGEGELLLERKIGREVVDGLGEDPCPVDGIHGTEMVGRVEGWVGEEFFDNILSRIRVICYSEFS